ncbi:MAG: hypothetical protein IJ409_00265 [Lachnospiraceae bacterium]|nr:hypothetical protein [Lachnospiraceae bacterium]
MVHEEKKVAKIIEELTMYFFTLGADEIKSGISKEEKHVEILFEANYSEEQAYRLEGLEQYLNGQKNEGMEDFYWELAGSGDPGEASQLLLVGMMIDRADIKVEPEKVTLRLYKELLL